MSPISLLCYLLTRGAEPFLRSRQLCSPSRTLQHFMEPEGSIPCSQESSTGPYPEPYQSSPHHPILSLSITPQLGHNCFLLNHFQLIIHYSYYHVVQALVASKTNLKLLSVRCASAKWSYPYRVNLMTVTSWRCVQAEMKRLFLIYLYIRYSF
jgi:hypothetical protein